MYDRPTDIRCKHGQPPKFRKSPLPATRLHLEQAVFASPVTFFNSGIPDVQFHVGKTSMGSPVCHRSLLKFMRNGCYSPRSLQVPTPNSRKIRQYQHSRHGHRFIPPGNSFSELLQPMIKDGLALYPANAFDVDPRLRGDKVPLG